MGNRQHTRGGSQVELPPLKSGRRFHVRHIQPENFDRLWQSLQERHGKHSGTREMIELLTLGKRYGWDLLQQVVAQSLALGCTDAAAVRLADGNGTGSSAG
jgi:hypothetical protein